MRRLRRPLSYSRFLCLGPVWQRASDIRADFFGVSFLNSLLGAGETLITIGPVKSELISRVLQVDCHHGYHVRLECFISTYALWRIGRRRLDEATIDSTVLGSKPGVCCIDHHDDDACALSEIEAKWRNKEHSPGAVRGAEMAEIVARIFGGNF